MSTGVVGYKDPLPEPEVKEVVNAWISTLKIPTVAGAYIREDDNFINVYSKWTLDEPAKKEWLKVSKTFAVLKSSLGSGSPVISTPAADIVDEKLGVASKSGGKRAVLVEKAGSGESTSKSEFLQIWENGMLTKTYNLGELDLHKAIYISAGWGITMAWSPNETKLAYLAEKKVPKAKPFYSSAAAPKKKDEADSTPDKEKETLIGEEYMFRQTWGEQLNSQYESVIVVLDLATDEFKVLKLPETTFPTDIQWIGNSNLCGTTYPIPIWRLGLIYCSNRESLIFSVQADGENFRLITSANTACRSPRVRPDGGYLVWQERILDGAHERARSIHGVELTDGCPSGQPKLLYDSAPQNGIPVYQDFSRNSWTSDGSTLLAVTPSEATMICLAIPIAAPEQAKKIEGVDSLLAVTNEYLLVGSSTSISGPHLRLLQISDNFKAIPVTTAPNPIDFSIHRELVSGELSPPSIYHGPSADSVQPNSVPLVVYPHGGPHSTFVDSFAPEVILFLKLGFAVLRLNYIGSTGGARDTADELLGKAGDRDVKDCQAVVQNVLNSMPVLNPDKIVVFGRSHGGFLTCHLSCQYPSIYKAAVATNPVTDLGSMVGTTDITDWVYAEGGAAFPEPLITTLIPTVRNLDDTQKYISASPIHLVDKVQAATLLLLGSEDLRVPHHQGLQYYRALKVHGKTAEVRVYPDNHPLGKAAVRLDNIIHSALWFKRYIR